MKRALLLVVVSLLVCAFLPAVVADCPKEDAGPKRVKCFEAATSSAAYLHQPIRQFLVGGAWEYCKAQGGHFRLFHCNSMMASSCSLGALCPTEYFMDGELTESQQDDVKKGLGLFTFTRPICPRDFPHGNIHNYNLQSKGHCAIIDPAVLLDQMFFVNAGDTGKTGALPMGFQNPLNLARKAKPTEADWAEWFATNERMFDSSFERAGSSEVNLVGCIPLRYVKAIDSTDPDRLGACVRAGVTVNRVTSDSAISDIVVEEAKLDAMGEIAKTKARSMPDVADSAVFGVYPKRMLAALKAGKRAQARRSAAAASPSST